MIIAMEDHLIQCSGGPHLCIFNSNNNGSIWHSGINHVIRIISHLETGLSKCYFSNYNAKASFKPLKMCLAIHNKVEFWLIHSRRVLCCIYFLLVMSSSQLLRWALTYWSISAPLLVWLPLGRIFPKGYSCGVVDFCWLLISTLLMALQPDYRCWILLIFCWI